MYVSDFDGITITMRKDWFRRTAGGNWQRKPWKTTTEEITAEQYINTITHPWRGDRTERGYTYAGYIPVKITNVEPAFRNDKFTATFCFTLTR